MSAATRTPTGTFRPAAGTDYTKGAEPVIAARLTRLALALHLNLIGLSGYRTPAHSVAVGGFPNDPHTRGQASDTPGIENVSEATLNKFGLTRPFAGAAEADHIQLLPGYKGTDTLAPATTKSGTNPVTGGINVASGNPLGAVGVGIAAGKKALDAADVPNLVNSEVDKAINAEASKAWGWVTANAPAFLLKATFILGGAGLAAYGLAAMLGQQDALARTARTTASVAGSVPKVMPA